MAPELEICCEAEEHLRKAERALIEARPAGPELQKSIEALQRLAILPRGERSEEFPGALRRIQGIVRILGHQTRLGLNLCLGWMQFSAEEGYGLNGQPVPAKAPARSWEI